MTAKTIHPTLLSGKKVLITGSNGFIGSRLIDRLLDQGCHLVGIDKVFATPPQRDGLELVRLDLSNEDELLSHQLKDIEYVFHLAALTRAERSQDLIVENARMTHNLLSALARPKINPVVVIVSSIAAVGPQKNEIPLDEYTSRNPTSDYGRSKVACEDIALKYADDLPISIVRPPIVLGQGDRVGLKMFKTIRDWSTHFVAGRKDHEFAVVHVDDLVQSLILVAARGKRVQTDNLPKGTYFISTQDRISYVELGRLIARILGIKVRVVFLSPTVLHLIGCVNRLVARFSSRVPFLNHDKIRDSLAGGWALDSSKIKREVGFQPSSSLEQRLAETIDWYIANGLLKDKTTQVSSCA